MHCTWVARARKQLVLYMHAAQVPMLSKVFHIRVHVQAICLQALLIQLVVGCNKQLSVLSACSPACTCCLLQYMHIPDRDRCNWLRERIETPELVRGCGKLEPKNT
jgi:hypothetical protein